jgi:hypothetical protein
MTDKGNGWYSYAFAETISNVNVIFSKNGSPQTVNIPGITASTCFEQNGLSGSNLTVSILDCQTSGIFNPESNLKVLIYPHPVTSSFNVEIPDSIIQNNLIMNILDLSGRVIVSQRFSGNRIIVDRGNLKSGLYILKIVNENNKQSISSKLSIE